MKKIINLEMDGSINTAFVSGIINRHHNMFKVVFINGYENIFYTDVETGKWMEEDLGFTKLAEDVGNEIRKFMRNPIHVPKLLTWHQQVSDGKMFCFGFFNFMNGSQKFYQIYNCNKKYMYTLVDMENEEWEILGNVGVSNKHIDTRFVHKLIQILPQYAVNVR